MKDLLGILLLGLAAWTAIGIAVALVFCACASTMSGFRREPEPIQSDQWTECDLKRLRRQGRGIW